jgi:hypothetical protein
MRFAIVVLFTLSAACDDGEGSAARPDGSAADAEATPAERDADAGEDLTADAAVLSDAARPPDPDASEAQPGDPPDAHAPDAGGPVTFTPLRAEELGATRVVIRFDTSRPTSCEAEYGLSADALDLTATDPEMGDGELSLDHQVPLEDLTPETTYHVRAKATDAAGDTYYSDPITLRTTAAPVDGGDLVDVATLEAGAVVAAVSSNWGGGANDSSFGADHAVDGQMGTQWSTAGDGDAAWLEIDLGAPRRIHAIGYRSREMADGTSIVTRFRVLLPDGGVLGPFDSPDPAEVYHYPLEAPVQVESLRWEAVVTTGGNTGARQILVHAAPD